MARLLMVVLWPSFLVAIVAEGAFFSVFDPAFLTEDGSLSPLAVYTIGFFFFWASCALASLLTCWLKQPPVESVHG